jgi:hypothetical protein
LLPRYIVTYVCREMEDDVSSWEKVFPPRTPELDPRPPALCGAGPSQVGNNGLCPRNRDPIDEAKVVATGKFLHHLSSDLPGCTSNDDTHRNTGPSNKTKDYKARTDSYVFARLLLDIRTLCDVVSLSRQTNSREGEEESDPLGIEDNLVYAQTNIQLFNQLRQDGYANIDLGLIRDAYELAIRLYSGYFIGSGRTQIAHVVGTASILGALHPPVEVVAAGLIHNVYDNGDFGDGRKGAFDARRCQIRQALGAAVEEYVYRFPAIDRVVVSFTRQVSSQVVSHASKELDALNPVDRQVLLIVLAEKLDHALSHEYTNRSPLRMREMAEKVGFPAMATELERAFSTPAMQRTGKALLLIPRSYRRRLWIILRPQLSRNVSRVRSALNIRKWLHHVLPC